MSESDQIKLVLHEQGHRLQYLIAFNDDERIVEGWADQLLGYLTGRISKDQFYATMAAYKLNLNGRFNFGPRKRAGTLTSYVEIPVRINKDFIAATTNLGNYDYGLALTKEAFNQYPGLNTKDRMVRIAGLSIQGLTYVDGFLEPIINGQTEGDLTLRVYYQTEQINRDGMISANDKVVSMDIATTHVEQMYLDTQRELKRYFTNLDADEIFYNARKSEIIKGNADFVKPISSIYQRPEMIFNPAFSQYKTNALRVAAAITRELQQMEAKNDPLASLLKNYFGQPFTWNEKYMWPDERGIEVLRWYSWGTTLYKPNLRPVLISFAIKPEVILRVEDGAETHLKLLQLEIHVTEQMTDEQVTAIVRAGLENARAQFKNYLRPPK